MRVEVRLFATLARYLPDDHHAETAVLDVADGSTVADVAHPLGIPADLSRIVLVNDRDATDDRPLVEGDVVTLFPPLAGGGGEEWYTHRGTGRAVKHRKRLGTRWASRTSNPVSGSRQAGGGFDSHTLPPNE